VETSLIAGRERASLGGSEPAWAGAGSMRGARSKDGTGAGVHCACFNRRHTATALDGCAAYGNTWVTADRPHHQPASAWRMQTVLEKGTWGYVGRRGWYGIG